VQVPLNIVFYTDTSARKIKIGKQTINFQESEFKKSCISLATISTLAIQALRTIGKDKVTDEELNHIKEDFEY
jgi:hypothetical protein